jgi:beta-glucuronidase
VNSLKGQLVITNRQTGEKVYDSAMALSKKKGDRHFSTTVTIANPQLWHFDHPNLYDFTFTIPGSDALSDHFGIREFKVVVKRFVLNGEEMRLPGIETMQGSNPIYGMAEPYSYIDKTVKMMKHLNTTITRFHWVQANRMLDDMDEMGMLAQEELSWWQQPYKELSPELHQTALEALEEMVEAHYNHPCIFAWGMSNEVRDNHKEIRQLADFVLTLDPNRIVDVACNHTNTLLDKDPSLVLDLPTWNDYLGSWHGPDQTLLPQQLARLDSAFAGRPLFITEAGLCEPAFTGGDARRVNDMCYHISEWQKQDFICGYIYFCLQDYRTQMGEEGLYKHRIRRHGVTKVDLTPKASYYVLRQLMNPIDITEVKPANAKRNEGSLAAQYNVSSDNPDAQIKLQVKATIPCYTLRGYELKYEDFNGVMQTIALPDMKPGETYPLMLKNVNTRYAFEIFRPDGTSVIEY